MERKNDIIYDAYYLINKFNNNGNNKVTNLQMQKLMYFFEAYYMLVHNDVEKLYDCNFNAWAFGPVAIPLYKEFKKFGNNPIELTSDNITAGNNIDKEKKLLLDNIYDVFKNVSATDLVAYTHMKNSPWSEVWEKNGGKVGYGDNTHIDKIKTRDWFKDVFTRQQ